MFQKVNVAVQIVPSSKEKHPYYIVDRAIDVIKSSGIKYLVTPFETVMEGDYDEIMNIVRQIQITCFTEGAEGLLCYIKIQNNRDNDVTINDKIGKYQ